MRFGKIDDNYVSMLVCFSVNGSCMLLLDLAYRRPGESMGVEIAYELLYNVSDVSQRVKMRVSSFAIELLD